MSETLINEKNEHLRRITDYLEPRIIGTIPVSVQEQEECVEEKKAKEKRIAEIDELLAQEVQEPQVTLPEAEVVVEEILTNISGERLEFYTESLAGAVLIRQEVRSMVEFEKLLGIEKLDEQKGKTEEYKTLFRNEQTAHGETKDKYSELEEKYEDVFLSESKLLIENNALEGKVVDLESKLTNAADIIQELEQKVKDAQQDANRNRQYAVQTDEEQTATIEAAKKEIAESKIEVYNIRSKEGEYPSVTLVYNIAETGKEDEISFYKKSKLVDVGLEKALEMQAMNKEPEAPPLIVEVASEEEIFPTEASAEESVLEGEQGVEQEDCRSDEQAVSEDDEAVEETWQQAVDRRLNALELKVNRNDTIINHELEVA